MIYLDYNATTPLASEVAESIIDALPVWGNPSSKYPAGCIAKKLIAEARRNIGQCINVLEEEIIFTSGGTESNNWVIYSAIEYFQSTKAAGDNNKCNTKPHVITTSVEHDSILGPLTHLKRKGDVDLTVVEIDKHTGNILPSDIAVAIKQSTVLVTVMMANNETGTVLPIQEIGKAVRKKEKELGCKIFFHTDAAQTVGKIPVDAKQLDVDFLTIVGHKFYGPRNGALYIKHLEKEKHLYTPLLFGGGQENGWRSGTENTSMIVGLGIAAELINKNLTKYQQNMLDTRNYFKQKLVEAFGKDVVFNCLSDHCLPNTCNFSILGVGLEGYKILEKAKGFSCSTGSACHSDKCEPSKILLNFHINPAVAGNALRISTGRSTSNKEIDVVVAELLEIRKSVL